MPVATPNSTSTTIKSDTMVAQKKGKRRSSKKPRSVSFAPNAQLRLYRCKMTESERRSYYYDENDYEEFKDEARATIEMIVKNMEIDEVQHCARGVICRTPDALRRRVSLRVKAWDAVFSEQARQWEKEGEDSQLNADALATAYTKQCYSSKRLAYTIAKCDEKTVAAFSTSSPSSKSSREFKRGIDHRLNRSNRTLVILHSMSPEVRSSRQLATSAA